jgi:hypothetical protein
MAKPVKAEKTWLCPTMGVFFREAVVLGGPL